MLQPESRPEQLWWITEKLPRSGGFGGLGSNGVNFLSSPRSRTSAQGKSASASRLTIGFQGREAP